MSAEQQVLKHYKQNTDRNTTEKELSITICCPSCTVAPGPVDKHQPF